MQVTYNITLPDGTVATMTGPQLEKFHDDLTKFLNQSWEALRANDDE